MKNAFSSAHFIPYSGYPFPTLSFRAQREIFFVPFFHDSFAMPSARSTVPTFPAIRCFPFLAAKHSPSYRQRKRSLGFARDDDTGRTRFPAHTLYHTADIHSPTLSFRAQREIFFVPFFHDSFAMPFTGSTAYRLSCDTVFPISRYRARSLLPPTKKIPRLRSG